MPGMTMMVVSAPSIFLIHFHASDYGLLSIPCLYSLIKFSPILLTFFFSACMLSC